MEKLMNGENEWNHRTSAGRKDKQIASGSMKLLRHWKKWKDKAPIPPQIFIHVLCIVPGDYMFQVKFLVDDWQLTCVLHTWHAMNSQARQHRLLKNESLSRAITQIANRETENCIPDKIQWVVKRLLSFFNIFCFFFSTYLHLWLEVSYVDE